MESITMVMMMTAEDESSSTVTTNPTRRLLKVFDVKRRIQWLAFSPTMDRMESDKFLTA